jgi:hypothetical protein
LSRPYFPQFSFFPCSSYFRFSSLLNLSSPFLLSCYFLSTPSPSSHHLLRVLNGGVLKGFQYYLSINV